jgi:hypothetical protein
MLTGAFFSAGLDEELLWSALVSDRSEVVAELFPMKRRRSVIAQTKRFIVNLCFNYFTQSFCCLHIERQPNPELALTTAFSCGARSASKLIGTYYLRKTRRAVRCKALLGCFGLGI